MDNEDAGGGGIDGEDSVVASRLVEKRPRVQEARWLASWSSWTSVGRMLAFKEEEAGGRCSLMSLAGRQSQTVCGGGGRYAMRRQSAMAWTMQVEVEADDMQWRELATQCGAVRRGWQCRGDG